MLGQNQTLIKKLPETQDRLQQDPPTWRIDFLQKVMAPSELLYKEFFLLADLQAPFL